MQIAGETGGFQTFLAQFDFGIDSCNTRGLGWRPICSSVERKDSIYMARMAFAVE